MFSKPFPSLKVFMLLRPYISGLVNLRTAQLIPLLTAMLLLLTLTVDAQPDWQWGKRGGSGGSSPGDEVVDMATDQNGNVYVLSVCSGPGTVDVDGHPGITPYDRLSVASWSCDGDFRWVKMFGSGSTLVTGEAIHVDTLGGVYIAGTMSSSSSIGGLGYFDTDTVLPENNKRMYLIKYDTGGNYQWLKMPQPDTFTVGGSYSLILDMDGTPNGDLYLYTLLIPGLYDSGAFAVTDTGMYIWKMNKDGVFQSLTRLDVTVSGTSSNRYGYDNLVRAYFKRDHQSGRYYLTGYYTPTYGTLTLGTFGFPGDATYNIMYISAFANNGNGLWTRIQDSTNKSAAIQTRAAINEQGNVFVGGGIQSGNSFDGHVFTNSLGASGVPLLIALDSNGNTVWITSGESNGLTSSSAIELVNGVIGASGKYGHLLWQGMSLSNVPGHGFIYLARFNATTGTIIGLDSLATGGLSNNATAMTSDKNGNLFVGGSFDASITVAGTTLYKTGGSYDWFVAKFGTANCNCTIPTANFAYAASGTAINFSYTGSTDYTSISWDFGDGTTATTPNPSHTFSDTGVHTVCVTVTNDCGSNVYCLEVSAPTGIEATSAAAVKVYPNPTTNSITVEGAGSGSQLLLYEVTGKLALEQTLRNSRPVNVNISHLPDGVYLLQFTDSKGRKGMTKVVKR